MMPEKICQTCSATFTGRSDRRYCSRSCYPSRIVRMRNDYRKEVHCGWCGRATRSEIRPSRKVWPACSRFCQSAVREYKRGNTCSVWPPTQPCVICGSSYATRSHAPGRCPVCRPELITRPRLSRFVAGVCWDCGAAFVGDKQAYFSIQDGHSFCSDRCMRRAARRRRRAREVNAPGSFRWIEVMRIFLAFGRTCAYCMAAISGDPDPDHVLPLSRGGFNDISNILPCCSICNSDKRDLTLDEWKEDRERRGKAPVRYGPATEGPPWSHLLIRTPRPEVDVAMSA